MLQDIHRFSKSPVEYEVVLPPQSTFRVNEYLRKTSEPAVAVAADLDALQMDYVPDPQRPSLMAAPPWAGQYPDMPTAFYSSDIPMTELSMGRGAVTAASAAMLRRLSSDDDDAAAAAAAVAAVAAAAATAADPPRPATYAATQRRTGFFPGAQLDQRVRDVPCAPFDGQAPGLSGEQDREAGVSVTEATDPPSSPTTTSTQDPGFESRKRIRSPETSARGSPREDPPRPSTPTSAPDLDPEPNSRSPSRSPVSSDPDPASHHRGPAPPSPSPSPPHDRGPVPDPKVRSAAALPAPGPGLDFGPGLSVRGTAPILWPVELPDDLAPASAPEEPPLPHVPSPSPLSPSAVLGGFALFPDRLEQRTPDAPPRDPPRPSPARPQSCVGLRPGSAINLASRPLRQGPRNPSPLPTMASPPRPPLPFVIHSAAPFHDTSPPLYLGRGRGRVHL